MAEFRMPSLGADMTAGTLVEWRVSPGDEVHRGDIVAVVDTEKAAIDVEVFTDGVVEELLVPPGTRVPVGTVLATLGPPGQQAPAAAEVTPVAPPPSAPPVPAAVRSPLVRRLAVGKGIDLADVVGSGPGGQVRRADVEAAGRTGGAPPAGRRLTPRARRMAAALGVDPDAVAGTGPGGVVTGADLERAAASPPEPAPSRSQGAEDRTTGMRRHIAELMGRANREIPHYYLTEQIDLGRALQWLAQRNAEHGVHRRILPIALLLKATALAARTVPEVNGHWVDDRFRAADTVTLGVAISLRGGGLVAPALPDADEQPLEALMAALRELVARARRGSLRSSDTVEPTITVTNLGEQGAESVHGVITPPQVALVGFGRIMERPWAEHGLLGVRPVVLATLAADHRASNGHVGGSFLTTLSRLLQSPEAL